MNSAIYISIKLQTKIHVQSCLFSEIRDNSPRMFFSATFECNHCQTVTVLSQLSLRDLWANNTEYGDKINISQLLRGISKNNNYWNEIAKRLKQTSACFSPQRRVTVYLCKFNKLVICHCKLNLSFFVLYPSAVLCFASHNHCIPQAL